MAEEDSFLALVHHDGEIKHSSREGVKFTSKNPTNVFITPRTRLLDLQRNIQRKICSNGKKRIGMIYYRIPISIVAQGVMYGSFAIQVDEDLQVLFHCRSRFPEVRTTELFVEILAPLASSGGSAPGQHSTNVAGPSRRAIQAEPEAQLIASPTFRIYNEAEADNLVTDLGDTGTGASQALCAPPVQRVPDPGVVEALRADDSDDEPPFIEGDSDDDNGPIPNQQGGASSSGTHQYPPHLSTLNLDVLSGPGRVQSEPSSGTQGSQGYNNQAKFQIGQTLVDKEVAVLAVKNYSIRRGVKYRVMESDHANGRVCGKCGCTTDRTLV
ncbi:hypothetical protein PIB30_022457 [Stylosanthes scabra]|uniref:Transposase MuDR plant domain-containing protein n=1 Tax=Stylosanthes scabra TaxID=79078 RepID=A0ABU6S9P5_9FABA|nr:hypothetical protein [Stylosanthes scabra]